MTLRKRMTTATCSMAMIAALMLGCSERINSPVGPGGGTGGAPRLVIVNQTSQTIFSLYSRVAGTSAWSSDMMSGTISAGSSYTDSSLPAGLYDLEVFNTAKSQHRDTMSIRLTAGTTTTWRISTLVDTGSTAGTTLTVYNNSSFTVNNVYLARATDSVFGNDRLGSSYLYASGSFTIDSLAAGAYSFKAISSGSHEYIRYSMQLSSGSNSLYLADSSFLSGELDISNHSSAAIYRVYRRSTGSQTWSANQISTPFDSGWIKYVPSIPQGTYDFRVENINSSLYAETTGVYIATDATVTWTVTTLSSGTPTPNLRIINAGTESVYYIFNRLNGTTTWSTDMLSSLGTLPVGDTLDTILPAGLYDLRGESTSHLRRADTTGFRLVNGSTSTWTVTILRDTGSVAVPTPAGQKYYKSAYTLNASLGELYTRPVPWIDTLTSCDPVYGLQTVFDTINNWNDTLAYALSGNTLTLEDWTDDVFTDPYAAVTYNMILTRQGAGTGLNGLWVVTDYTQTVLSGSLTVSEQVSSDTSTAVNRYFLLQTQWQVLITTDSISNYFTTSGLPAALARSSGAYLALQGYQVSASYPSAGVVTLYGLVTWETATIQYSMLTSRKNSWRAQFSSSNTSNLPGYLYKTPTFCPNDRPAWYDAFLTGNAGMGKRSALQPNRGGGAIAGIR